MYSTTLSIRNNYSQYLRILDLIDSLDDLEEYSEDFLDRLKDNKHSSSVHKITVEKRRNESDSDGNENKQSSETIFAVEKTQQSSKKRKKSEIENPLRGLKDSANPLNAMSDEDIVREYKISRKSISDIVELIKGELVYLSNRGLPFPPLMHFLITLKYLTTGSTQKHAMNGVSQSTTSRIINKVTGILAKCQSQYIQLPNQHQAEQTKLNFFQNGKFPQVIGCVGCFHVGVKVQKYKDSSYSSNFRNENGYHSLKVQVIIGPNGQIYDIDSKCPGSVHENNVFDLSEVHKKQTAQTLQGVFIGNDNYNPTNCLLTCVKNPQTTGDYYYNDALTKTYSIYHDAVNTLKRRFKCLQMHLLCKFVTQQNVIMSCALIHNIANNNNDCLLLEDEQSPITEPTGHKVYTKKIEVPVIDNNALMERESFIRRHFPSYYGNQSSSYLYL